MDIQLKQITWNSRIMFTICIFKLLENTSTYRPPSLDMIDIDPIFKIIQQRNKQIFGIFQPHIFPHVQNFRFANIIFSKHASVFFVFVLSILVSRKSNVIGFGSHGHVRQVRKTMNMMGVRVFLK